MSLDLQYKCPCCGGYIEFNSDVQKMLCPFCDTTFETETLRQYDQELQEDNIEEKVMSYDEMGRNGQWGEGELKDLGTYACSSCGGQLVMEHTTSVTRCPYCDNPVVLVEQLSGVYRPDYVIPFKLDKEDAKKRLKDFYKKKKLLPSLFSAQNHIESIQGMYVPFWLFDCDTNAHIRYKATRVRHYSDSDYNYTETSHYSVVRGGDFDFDKVPVDGSEKMSDTYMEAIEPYDYNEMVDFQTAYLSGYMADKYDVEADNATTRVNERIRQSVQDILQPSGYTTCHIEKSNINTQKGDIQYALLPVWMLNTKYKDKVYTFAMNGQTGKFVGKLPVDVPKAIGYFLGVFASVAAVASAVIYFL